MTRCNDRAAFTLIEMLIVVVILGILASIVIPYVDNASDQAKFSSLKTNLQQIRSALKFYKMQHNDQYPIDNATTDIVDALTEKTATDHSVDANGYGPYLESIPVNPFNGLSTIDNSVGTPNAGWCYTPSTGAFIADDGGSTNGIAHSSL